MPKTDVLFVGGGSYVYGAEKINLAIIAGAAKAGLQVFCTVTGWNDGNYKRVLKDENIPFKEIYLGWYYLKKPLWTIDSLIHAPKAFFEYRKLFRRLKPTVNYHYSLRTLFLLFPWLRGKTILHIHDESFLTKQGKFLLEHTKSKVDLFIACSKYIADRLIEANIPDSKIRVVYNFTTFPESRFECSKRVKQNGIHNIAIVGQITAHKGHELLLDALKLVQDRGGRFKLHIIGNGDIGYISKLKAKSKELNLTENIIWRGYISDRADIYREIDFVVVPSIRPEPFGLVAIEPAAFCLPAIVAELGGLNEIVQHGETGLKFESGNKEDLAEKILRYLNEPASSERMGVNAFENYRSRFSFINQIREFSLLLHAN